MAFSSETPGLNTGASDAKYAVKHT
jgi:hypothetical protein